jgi:hypothetical protein
MKGGTTKCRTATCSCSGFMREVAGGNLRQRLPRTSPGAEARWVVSGIRRVPGFLNRSRPRLATSPRFFHARSTRRTNCRVPAPEPQGAGTAGDCASTNLRSLAGRARKLTQQHSIRRVASHGPGELPGVFARTGTPRLGRYRFDGTATGCDPRERTAGSPYAAHPLPPRKPSHCPERNPALSMRSTDCRRAGRVGVGTRPGRLTLLQNTWRPDRQPPHAGRKSCREHTKWTDPPTRPAAPGGCPLHAPGPRPAGTCPSAANPPDPSHGRGLLVPRPGPIRGLTNVPCDGQRTRIGPAPDPPAYRAREKSAGSGRSGLTPACGACFDSSRTWMAT